MSIRMRPTAVLCFLSGLSCLVSSASCAEDTANESSPFSATIRVTEQVLNTVRPLIFGDNIEWTNSGMGLWLPDKKSFDSTLLELLRPAGITHLRYPGGTLSDFFLWHHAVGDPRTPIPNPFSQPEKGEPEYPHFGPHEFMALCRELKIPATITLNAGTGTPEDAARWVKYFAEQGFEVASYAVGNEIYMADKNDPVKKLPINKSPREYVDFYLRCKTAIDAVAPGTRLGVIGLHDTGNMHLNKHPDWMKTILSELGDKIDFIDVHNGYAPVIRSSGIGWFSRNYPDDDYAECFMGASVYVRDNIQQTKALIEQHAPGGGQHVELQVTEYGPLVYPFDQKRMVEDAAWNRSLCGALYLACLYNVFLAEPRLTSANHLPLCQDVFGALVGVRGQRPERKEWRNIVYHVFRMYSAMQRRAVLQTDVVAPMYSTRAMGIVPKMADVPYVDAGAYRTVDGNCVSLFLINRSVTRHVQAEIDPGFAPFQVESITTLSAESYRAENSPDQPDNVVPRVADRKEAFAGAPLKLTLPRHSLTVVDFRKPAP